MSDAFAGRLLSRPIIAVLVFVATIHAGWWVFGDQIVSQDGFADGDSFQRLLRVERLVETRDWYDITIPDANAPFGATLHWTRLFDIVLLAIALPLTPFLGFSSALYWAGTLISPILHMTSAAALAWALIPVLGRYGAALAGALTGSQAGVLAFSLVGRADHHMMFVFLATLALGFLFRSLVSPKGSRWHARLAGASVAAGLWVGPENLLFMLICLGTAGLHWLFTPEEEGGINLDLTTGLVIGLAASLMIERGISGFSDVEYDRISMVHLVMSLLLAGFWSCLVWQKNRLLDCGFGYRLMLAGLGTVTAFLVLFVLFPKFLGNPLNDANPAIQPIYERISEYRQVVEVNHFLIYFGSIIFVFPWLIHKLSSFRNSPVFWCWIGIATGAILYTLLGVTWLRWCMYAALFLSIGIADLVVAADSRVNRKFGFPVRVAVKAMVMSGLIVGPMFAGALLLHSQKSEDERAKDLVEACPVLELAKVLNSRPWSERSRIINASANFGGEIMYRTDHQVLATVHHRNVSGILDGHEILNSPDEERVRDIIRKRQVDLVLICPGSSDDSYFLMGDDPLSLYARLVKGALPDWISEVALRNDQIGNLRLFEIRHPL